MARAKNKQELVNSSEENYIKLTNLIDSMSDKQLEHNFPFDENTGKEAHWARDENVKDVLIHLHEWHILLINWVNNNLSNNLISFLIDGYNWRTYGNMNQEFKQKHRNTSFQKAYELFIKSHKEVMELVQIFDDDQLFLKDKYDWVGGSTLGSYFISTTSSHYEWAIKKIKKFLKESNI